MEEEIPVTVWECINCDAQFYLITNITPDYCPTCLKYGTLRFLDDIENDSWRPPDSE